MMTKVVGLSVYLWNVPLYTQQKKFAKLLNGLKKLKNGLQEKKNIIEPH